MFQYALYRSLREKFDNVKLDITPFDWYKLHNGYLLEKVFNIKPIYAKKEELKYFYEILENKSLIVKLKRKLIRTLAPTRAIIYY